MQFLANELQRFRNKQPGCAFLAEDHGFSIERSRPLLDKVDHPHPAVTEPTGIQAA